MIEDLPETVKNIVCILLLTTALSGCVNLLHIREFSSKALEGIKKIDEVDYGFTQHCLDRCQLAAIDSFKIYRGLNCPCNVYVRADSVLRILNKAVGSYFDGLSRLSKNDLTSYNVNPLAKALKEEDAEPFVLRKDEVNAHAQLVAILLRAFTDSFRQKEIKQFIRSANPPLQIMLSKLEYIESKNLKELLDFKKERIFDQYNRLLRKSSLSDYEKQRATGEYYEALAEIQNRKEQIIVCSKSLKAIAGGHQKIAENLDQISAVDLKGSIISYAREIQDLISEFNKIKRQ